MTKWGDDKNKEQNSSGKKLKTLMQWVVDASSTHHHITDSIITLSDTHENDSRMATPPTDSTTPTEFRFRKHHKRILDVHSLRLLSFCGDWRISIEKENYTALIAQIERSVKGWSSSDIIL